MVVRALKNIGFGFTKKNFREILSRHQDPIYFAGEHTATQRASMNGAIESGFRVTEELKKAMSNL